MPGAQRTAIGITGNRGEVEQGTLEEMAGVQEVIKVSKPYKLVSRDVKQDNTIIHFPGSDATIGGHGLAIIAGPCSIETREQAFIVAERVNRAGAQFFRGGAYKPRTSPYAFQGLGEEALRIMLQMWGDDDGPFEGEHYHLARTLNSPQALSRPHPPILIGGSGEKKTLRLVAKYADSCNIFGSDVEQLAHKLDG